MMGLAGANGMNGADGMNGTNGADGMAGTNGVNGMNGANGTNGADGVSVTTSAVDAGSLECPFGGTAIVATNGTRFVCNGAPGTPGQNGSNGSNGTNGSNGADGVSVTINALSVGDTNCPTGGTSVTGANGTRFVCNGAKGEPGDAGPPGPPGPRGPTSIATCPAGMTKVVLPYSTVCFEAGIVANFDTAGNYCWDQFRASICSLTQWRAVVCRAGLTSPGRSWLPNPVAADTLATISNCASASLGTSNSGVSTNAGPCCLEWMNY